MNEILRINFLFRCTIIGALLFIELLCFWYSKNGSNAYLSVNSEIVTVYLQNYGGPQFFIVGYIQRIIFLTILAYFLAVVALIFSSNYFIKTIKVSNYFRDNILSYLINILCFITLLIQVIAIKNPQELISRSFSIESIALTLSPILWILYLLNACNLIYPIKNIFELSGKDKLLVISILIGVIGFNIVPLEGFAENSWFKLLIKPTVYLAEIFSRWFGLNTVTFVNLQDAIIFGTSRFHVEISEPCSGYEGMSLVMALLATYIFIQRSVLRLSRALIIIPIACLAMFIFNAIRLVILIAIGNFYSRQIALNGFHSVAGWLNLLIVFIICLFLLNKTPFFQITRSGISRYSVKKNRIYFLFPLMAIISSSLVTKAFTGDFYWLYPIPIGLCIFILIKYSNALYELLERPSYIAVSAGLLVFFIWIYLIPADNSISLNFFNELQNIPIWVAIAWLVCRIFGAIIIVPISEELAFRGFLLPQLESYSIKLLNKTFLLKVGNKLVLPLSILLSLASTSLLFGILHSEIIAGTVAGFVFGLVYLCRHKIIDAIVAHAIANAMLAIDIIYFGNWSYW